jgi:hypothetical protein
VKTSSFLRSTLDLQLFSAVVLVQKKCLSISSTVVAFRFGVFVVR